MNGSVVDGGITVFFFHAVVTCTCGVDDIGMVASGFVEGDMASWSSTWCFDQHER
jgi:hypothetical protein